MEQNYTIVSADKIIEFDEDGSLVAEPPLPVTPILSEEEQAFADAVKRYQIDHRRALLTWRDIFEIVQSLGYRKVEQPAKPPEANGSPQDPAPPDAAGNEKPS